MTRNLKIRKAELEDIILALEVSTAWKNYLEEVMIKYRTSINADFARRKWWFVLRSV